jgi:hypothetical protein
MRREWSVWIKSRQWNEFEKLAKSDPSQQLVNTVAELERGFPDKPDKRALRKILFLLAQAGYLPAEIDEKPDPTASDPVPLTVAFMVSPDGAGDAIITYGKEERNRVSWLIAHFTRRDGITRAIEDTMTMDELHVRLMRMRNLSPSPSICAEVPVSFALSRLAEAVSITKSLPPVMAYWRGGLPKEFSVDHPADQLPRLQPSGQDLRKLIVAIKPANIWRLELGAMAPALEEFLEKYAKETTEEQFNSIDWWSNILAPRREELFSSEVIEDHLTRLLDVAYLLHLKADAQVTDVLAVADDLREKGPHSAYAQWIASKTLILLFETLRQDDAKERS